MNQYKPHIHQRRSIRLKGYDYSQEGLYFITICVQNRECLFGRMINEGMVLNDAGKMVETEWCNLMKRFINIDLHEYVVMPNHFHAILEIVVGASLVGALLVDAPLADAQNQSVAQNDVDSQTSQPQGDGQPQDAGQPQGEGQPQGIAPTAKTIGDMMDAFKSITTVGYIRGVKTLGWQRFDGKLWQRNYYEHIIRNEPSYQRISQYIINNPAKWSEDKFYQP